MKNKLILLTLIIQGLFTTQAQPAITVVSPAQGDILTIGTNHTIQVVIQSSVQTNAWIWLNGLGNGYALTSGWLSMGQHITIGKTTNTYSVPNIFGGDGFSVTIATEEFDATTGVGSINPYVESGEFTITDLPTIQISPDTNVAWRPGEVKTLTYKWRNMHAGDTNVIWLGWNDPLLWPANSEEYGFKLCSTVLTAESGTNTVQVTVPSNALIGQHFIRIINETSGANNFATGVIYVGTSNAPTVAKITGITVELPVGDKEGQATLSCEGLPNWGYHIQESTDLLNWNTVTPTPIMSPSGSFYFRSYLTNSTGHFYRMLQVPHQ